MNKSGVIWETIADVFLAGFILFVGITIFFVVSGDQERQVERYFSNRMITKNNDNIFVSMVNAKVADEIDKAVVTDDVDALKDMLDESISKIFSTKMCWVLNKDGKEWISANSCKKKEDLMDSTVILPAGNFEIVELNLKVNGYAK